MFLAEAVCTSTNHNFLNKRARNLNIMQWKFQNTEFIKRMHDSISRFYTNFKKCTLMAEKKGTLGTKSWK